jgi:hypothetical protein
MCALLQVKLQQSSYMKSRSLCQNYLTTTNKTEYRKVWNIHNQQSGRKQANERNGCGAINTEDTLTQVVCITPRDATGTCLSYNRANTVN